MLKDITLGQYYPAKSVIHQLDPRVKLFGTMLFIISLFSFRGIPAFVLATIFLIWVIHISKVPFSFLQVYTSYPAFFRFVATKHSYILPYTVLLESTVKPSALQIDKILLL